MFCQAIALLNRELEHKIHDLLDAHEEGEDLPSSTVDFTRTSVYFDPYVLCKARNMKDMLLRNQISLQPAQQVPEYVDQQIHILCQFLVTQCSRLLNWNPVQ